MNPTPLIRKSAVAAIAALSALAVLLSACGSGTSDSDGATRTVEHAMGTTEVPAKPERIVVLDSPPLDALLALGITPVGAPEIGVGRGFPAYLSDKLGDTKPVGYIAEPDVDAVANLAPDLIIGSKERHEALYGELSAIAPTVFAADSGTNWSEQAKLAGAAVGKSAEIDALLAGVDERAKQVGAKVGAAGKTASIVRFRSDNFRLYGPGTFSGSLLTTMGFDLGKRDWNKYSMMELSPELFEQIDGQVAFYMSPGGKPDATSEATITKLWSGIPSVRAGKAFSVQDDTWMVGIGVIGAGLIIDQVEELLA